MPMVWATRNGDGKAHALASALRALVQSGIDAAAQLHVL